MYYTNDHIHVKIRIPNPSQEPLRAHWIPKSGQDLDYFKAVIVQMVVARGKISIGIILTTSKLNWALKILADLYKWFCSSMMGINRRVVYPLKVSSQFPILI